MTLRRLATRPAAHERGRRRDRSGRARLGLLYAAPPRPPPGHQGDKEAGQAAEDAFASWLDKSRVPYLYIEQSRETFAQGLGAPPNGRISW